MTINSNNPPPIGSPEAAVLACVNLIAAALETRETQLAYWLDCYYQLRRRYELQQGEDIPDVPIRRADLETVLRELWRETLSKGRREEAQRRMEAREGPEVRLESKPADGAPESKPAPSAQSAAAAAAAEKRAILDRLQNARAGGITIPEIVKAAEGKVTENQILTILDRGRMGIEIYRALAAALDILAPHKSD